MEDFGSFWTIQENVEELKQKLQYVTYELEITRKETNEEIKKNSEHIKKLLQLLQTTYKERDDAISQLKKLHQILAFTKPTMINVDQFMPTQIFPPTPFSPDSPLFTNFPAARSNSGLTESNSFSVETTTTTNNNSFSQTKTPTQSHVSSPVVDSLSSPESNNFCGNAFATAVLTTTTTTATTTPAVMQPVAPAKVVDQATFVIEALAKGKPRPTQGKLLQAVLEAGPLLQTLMVAGSLPRWRNPPGAMTQQIPPVNLKGCTSTTTINGVEPMSQNTQIVKGLSNSPYYGQINGGSMGVYQNSMLDFGGGASSSSCSIGGRVMMPSDVSFDCQIPKRQRLF